MSGQRRSTGGSIITSADYETTPRETRSKVSLKLGARAPSPARKETPSQSHITRSSTAKSASTEVHGVLKPAGTEVQDTEVHGKEVHEALKPTSTEARKVIKPASTKARKVVKPAKTTKTIKIKTAKTAEPAQTAEPARTAPPSGAMRTTRSSANRTTPYPAKAPKNSSKDSPPKALSAFQVKEDETVTAQAGNDYLLQRPAADYQYVNHRKRQVRFNDDRFWAPPQGVSEDTKNVKKDKKGKVIKSESPFAGIPSNQSYRPTFSAGHFTNSSSTQLKSAPPAVPNPKTNIVLQEEAFHARPSVKLIIPDVLKAMLVDDWENITKNNQLVPLPHPKPVTMILMDYAAYEAPKRPAGSSHVDILDETLAGLKEYFDKSLGRILLYRFERAQYADIHKKWMSDDPEFQGKSASDTYGAEHMMRLMVSLPELIAQTNMDQQSVNRLREELAKFCTWLSKNVADYFVNNYESPTQDYIDKAKN